jgi:threonyl-tRNA synthetase
VVGDKEIEADSVSLRLRSKENLGLLPVDEVIERITAAIREKQNV